MTHNIFYFLLVSIILAGCVSTSSYKYTVNTKPYSVSGVTYYPMASVDKFTEKGQASWYGPGFHGKKTASGEVYNKNAFTAAHKTLPFGTKVKVTNLSNGLSTNVVINDRGPFKNGRVIDLSYAAAKEIGMRKSGIADVRIDVGGGTKVVEFTPKSVSSYVEYFVQVGAYIAQSNANKTAVSLKNGGYKNVVKHNNGRYMVWVGPYNTYAQAEKVRDKLRSSYSDAFIVK